jgi:hypothetical protein
MDGALMTSQQSPDQASTLKRVQGYLKAAKRHDERTGWRKRALEGVRMYFGDQWDEDAKATVQGRGQPVITNNRLKLTVKVVLGLLLSRPMDWQAKPVGANDDDLSEAGTAALKWVANRSRMPQLQKRWYFDDLTAGITWALVGPRVRWKDPRREIVQHRRVDWREVRKDPRSQELDGSDMQWAIWSRKISRADLIANYKLSPDQVGKLAEKDPNLTDRENDSNGVTVVAGPTDLTPPPSMWERFEDWNKLDQEPCDEGDDNKQVVVHRVYEYRDTKVWLYEGPDGSPLEFDGPHTPEGMQIIRDPRTVTYYVAPVPKVWEVEFSGEVLLSEKQSQSEHDRIPLIPCYYEMDEHGDPVSFVEALKDMQREVNYRRSKMLHELHNALVAIDPKVLGQVGLTQDAIKEIIQTPGGILPIPPEMIKFLTRGDLAAQQFQVMQASEEAIQRNAGTNDHLMGYDTPAESGKAKEISVAQGQTAQRDAEQNLITFHQQIGELTLSDICTFHKGPWVVRVTDDVGKDKFITLNERQLDPATGQIRTLRDLNSAAMEVEIDEVPWTPTLRQRAFAEINDMANQEPDPILRRAYRRIAFTVGDMPERSKILDMLTEAEQQSQAAAQQQQQPQAQEPKRTIADIIKITPADLTPSERAQVFSGLGIQPDPQGPPPQQGAGQQPPPLDPNKVLQAQAQIATERIKHAHDGEQAAKNRVHEALMTHAQQQHEAAMAAMQAAHQQAQQPQQEGQV